MKLKVYLACILIGLAGCSEDKLPDEPEPGYNGQYQFVASIENMEVETKTIVNEDGSIQWNTDEAVGLYGENTSNARFKMDNASVPSASATFSGFLAGNAVTGIQLSSGIFMPLLGQISISPAAMHRIGCFAISILDTIPINAAVISGLATCGLTHKEGYGPIFRTTVLYIFFGMLAVILMCVLFPGLCAA